MVNEKLFFFSPVEAKKADYDDLNDILNRLIGKYNYQAKLPFEVAKNIEVMSNMLFIYGIFEAKLSEEVSLLKLEADKKEAKAIYEERKKWMETHMDKPPAMSYFEALAADLVTDIREKQYKQDGFREAFRSSYESIREKINAQKRLLEAMGNEVI